MGVFIVPFYKRISDPAKTKFYEYDASGCDSVRKIATLFLFAAWMSVLIFYMLKSCIYDTSIYNCTLIHFQIFSTHGRQTFNVYETLHSLYTKRCSLAVYAVIEQKLHLLDQVTPCNL